MKPNYEETVLRYKDMVYRIAFAQCPCRQDAEDVFQDVFLKLYNFNGDFSDEVYVIMSDGELVKADFNGGYEKPDGNICTCSYDLTYWDENDYKIFINADDIAAISINGTVYELQ